MSGNGTGRARVDPERRGCGIYFRLEHLRRVLESRPVQEMCRCTERVALAGLKATRSAMNIVVKKLEEDLGRRASKKQSFRKIRID